MAMKYPTHGNKIFHMKIQVGLPFLWEFTRRDTTFPCRGMDFAAGPLMIMDCCVEDFHENHHCGNLWIVR